MSSIFEQINKRAEARKAQRCAAYVALSPEVWYDDTPDTITLTTIGDTGTRSTTSVIAYSTHTTIQRPTEALALLAAAGFYAYEDELPLMMLPKRIQRKKYCIHCETRKPLSAFSPDKRKGDGRHSYCKQCRAELQRQRWRRSA
jgi:hypothetical protein